MTIGRPYRRSRKKKNRNTAHAAEDLYTVVTAYTHLMDRRYAKNVRKRSREGKKMAEIWMICKPDLEYRIGVYAYETDMDKAYVHKLADKVAEKSKCKTIVKVL